MKHTAAEGEPHHEEFSLYRFAVTIGATLAALLGALRFLAPGAWADQFLAPAWKAAAAFLAISLLNCFIEFFFHRYVLHMPAIPFLRHFYRQHTLHHSLTRIGRRQGPGGVGYLVVENKYPITEPEQGEASFFPWYSLAVFAAILTPLLILLQWTAPSFPWFLSGFVALAASITLYEVLHAINHWPFETWAPLISHPRWGAFWRPAYAFHLRHHAVIDCNESISGFLGLPIADWAFGTCIIPSSVYAEGEEWAPVNFQSPRPVAFIAWLDAVASGAVKRRRAAAGAGARPYTRGEEIANWVTHGIGLALSIAGLTLLVVLSSLRGTAWHIVSFTVFGLALLGLYSASALYHAYQEGRAKRFLLKLDHAAAFILVAGTFTPILLTSLRGPWGWSLFGIIWGLCGAAAVYRLVFGAHHRLTSAIAFVFLGWLTLVALKPLLAGVPPGALWLLLSGILCYLVGAAFRQLRNLKYHRTAWHTLKLGGSACHLVAVLLFLLPR
ncbi:MAG TPA: hemolysin III family protein [Opitutaceae bacterium]|jgi:hemolysin III